MVAPNTPSVAFPAKDSAGTVFQGRTLPLDGNGAVAVAPTKADGTPIDPATLQSVEALATILGVVGATPAANTIGARLKAIGEYLDGVEGKQDAGNTLLTAIDAKLAIQAGYLDQLEPYLDGVEGSLASILAKLIAAPATEAKQDAQVAAIATIGTRAYGTGTRLAVTGATAQSAAIAATEVMLHATARCFVKAGANPTAVDTGDSILLEAGEKFTMRITSGHKIAAIRSAADVDGALFITPVA